jgi:uncharacterized membrane protein
VAFCPNCGSQATGSFCPNCGTPLGSSYAPRPGASAGGLGISENIAAALCYTPFLIGILCSIVFLVVSPYNTNRFVRFHALQSLFLHLALFVFSILFSAFLGVVALATHGIGALFGLLYPVFWLGTIILFLVLMYQAFNRQRTKLPYVGDFAEKQV